MTLSLPQNFDRNKNKISKYNIEIMNTQYQHKMQIQNRLEESVSDFRLFPSADSACGIRGVKLKRYI